MEKNQMILEAYMSAYLYELETMINKNNKIFEKVKFQQDEANTDKDVKEAIKKFIVDECNRITLINQVSIDNVTYNIDKNSFVRVVSAPSSPHIPAHIPSLCAFSTTILIISSTAG